MNLLMFRDLKDDCDRVNVHIYHIMIGFTLHIILLCCSLSLINVRVPVSYLLPYNTGHLLFC